MKRLSISALQEIALTPAGLTDFEVQKQRQRFGINRIIDSGNSRFKEIFLETIRDPMIWFLLTVSSLFFLVGKKSDTITLLIAIVPLMLMDTFLHWRTKAATGTLKKNLSRTATVLRNGHEVTIDSEEIVPGDLLLLSAGDLLPADGFIKNQTGARVDESLLTGESLPVKKLPLQLTATEIEKLGQEIFIESENLASAGTRLLSGSAHVRVLYTGKNTEYGKIVTSIAEMPAEKTPLQVAISKLILLLVAVAFLFCILLVVVRRYHGDNWIDSILAGLTLAVAALPEEFPLVFTFYLGIGIYRLAKNRALVRRAVSIENIGRTTHICTDKTGTITIGKLKVNHIEPFLPVTAEEVLQCSLAASQPKAGDSIDLAIAEYAKAQKIDSSRGIFAERFSFTEDRKKETVIFTFPDKIMAYSKGAPETILAMTRLSKDEQQSVLNRVKFYADSGHKVLACAGCELPKSASGQEPDTGFTFLGLLAFEDPARPEVKDSILEAVKKGIKVIMITGDHPATGASIAKDIGLGGPHPCVVSAEENPRMFEMEYLTSDPEFLNSLDVVARCSPFQKLNIVKALKQLGHSVTVTGDGINDVPALKAADVGIAMGERGSHSAKEVASIVLADDNFRSIVGAIKEGRQLFQNLRRAFEYLLLIHIPLVLSAALLPFAGYPVVFLPVHIVWLELIIHSSAILGFQLHIDTDLKRPGRFFFNKREVFMMVFSAVVIAALIGWMYISDIAGHGVDFARTRTLIVMSFWSSAIVMILTAGEGRLAVSTSLTTFVASILVIQFGGLMSDYIHVVPMTAAAWLTATVPVLIFSVLLWYLKKSANTPKNLSSKGLFRFLGLKF